MRGNVNVINSGYWVRGRIVSISGQMKTLPTSKNSADRFMVGFLTISPGAASSSPPQESLAKLPVDNIYILLDTIVPFQNYCRIIGVRSIQSL
jgi:hypothetical protein